MNRNQQTLLFLLNTEKPFSTKQDRQHFQEHIKNCIQSLTMTELADLFVDSAFLSTSMKFLSEEHWLFKQKNLTAEIYFKSFVSSYFSTELSPILFLHQFLENSCLFETKNMSAKALQIQDKILTFVLEKSFAEQKQFATKTLLLMSQLFEFENQMQLDKKSQGINMGLSLYRTFDSLDKIFNLNYLADQDMKTDLQNTERLYEGAGVGVQSGYSTVLTALRYLNPQKNARLIDLGSGYGRVGLVVGLLRPDVDFIGYEYVQHRVDISNTTSHNLSIAEHVRFLTQDLSAKKFQIPEADIYYLYDPFSEDTYKHVLSQLINISRHKKISIATKGNARGWLMTIAKNENWPAPREFDNGNLCIFDSQHSNSDF